MFKKFYFLFIFICMFISLFSSFDSSNSNISNFFIYPTNTTQISSYFGYRELFGKENFHNGIDFPAPRYTEVYATASGTITYSGFLNGYGNTLILSHFDGTKSLYGHLDDIFISKTGDTVNQGKLIGYVGPKYLSSGILNGATTGPHLHFSFFNKDGVAIDPLVLI